jgi:hypothetical protein
VNIKAIRKPRDAAGLETCEYQVMSDVEEVGRSLVLPFVPRGNIK